MIDVTFTAVDQYENPRPFPEHTVMTCSFRNPAEGTYFFKFNILFVNIFISYL